MKAFTSLDLQQRAEDVERAAHSEPVIITTYGQPRLIIATVEEFVRLKEASGEVVPPEIRRESKAIVQKGLPDDPLGYDVSDLRTCASAMAEAALSGRNRRYVDAEIEAVEKRLASLK